MGVMPCSRRDCDNVMCNAYNSETGYICYECLQELENIQKVRPQMDVIEIRQFMDTPKQNSDYIQPMINLTKFFGLDE